MINVVFFSKKVMTKGNDYEIIPIKDMRDVHKKRPNYKSFLHTPSFDTYFSN